MVEISETDLPEAISAQFQVIVETDKRIQEAERNCATAKETADKMILAKAFNQKDAINATQDAVRSLTEAQTALSDAQRMLFENQQKLVNGMRYLLMLGASSITMNRIVITELETKLRQATNEQLSENAREELFNVVRLLREQESAFSKQDRMSNQIKLHSREIESIHRIDAIQDETDKKHDSLIAENASKNMAQDNEIARQQKVDERHDEQLKKVKTLAWIGVAIAACALVIAIIGLFL
ncbi:MAG: hypothetical protein ACI4DK_14715 [Lachnospiraceae bacterium]